MKMKNNKLNIGIVSLYGFPRGICYITERFIKTLKPYHNIFLLKRTKNEIENEFEPVENILEVDDYDVDPNIFEEWLVKNNINWLVFNEEQWKKYQKTDLVDICKKHNVKTAHYVVWEYFNPDELDYFEKFDVIICPTKSCYNKLRSLGLLNAKFIKWGVYLNDYKIKSLKKTEDKDITFFFHPRGFGGRHERKNTDAVIQAFEKLNRADARLIITDQKLENGHIEERDNISTIGGTLSQESIFNIYNLCDAVVLPSKFEGLGLPFLEAMAFGKPVITVDAPPMNEFIKDNANGCLSKIEKIEYHDDIYVDSVIVNIDDMRKKMDICCVNLFRASMGGNARKLVEDEYDWEKNKKEFLKIFEEQNES